jgi:transposase
LIPIAERSADRVDLRKPGGGRKPMPPRQIFSAIVYVLRTGCQWKALPREFGSASAVHLHFQTWQQAGFFLRLWQAGLAEYDEMEAIAWNWQSIDVVIQYQIANDLVANPFPRPNLAVDCAHEPRQLLPQMT